MVAWHSIECEREAKEKGRGGAESDLQGMGEWDWEFAGQSGSSHGHDGFWTGCSWPFAHQTLCQTFVCHSHEGDGGRVGGVEEGSWQVGFRATSNSHTPYTSVSLRCRQRGTAKVRVATRERGEKGMEVQEVQEVQEYGHLHPLIASKGHTEAEAVNCFLSSALDTGQVLGLAERNSRKWKQSSGEREGNR